MTIEPNFPHIEVKNEGGNPRDAVFTRQLCESCKDGDFYKCPRCTYSTVDISLFCHHMAEEINSAMLKLSELYKTLPTNRPRP
jgi:hypothetical protein